MRRYLALVGMLAALVAAHLANAWFETNRPAGTALPAGELRWLPSLLPIGVVIVAVGLGRIVLRGPRPDPLLGAIYALVGFVVVFAVPASAATSISLPTWLGLAELARGLMLGVWIAAALLVTGIAELVRWLVVRARTIEERTLTLSARRGTASMAAAGTRSPATRR